MWVILEGSDAVGKTTLASELVGYLGESAEIAHLGPPKGDILDELFGPPYATYAPGHGHDLVSDRYAWGDPVYAPIYRPETDIDGYGALGQAGWRYAEMFIQAAGGVTFLVEAPPEAMRAAFLARGDDYANIDDLENIVEKYRWLAGDSPTYADTAKMALDPDWSGSVDAIEMVEWLAHTGREAEATYAPLASFKHYVGPINPDLLIICQPDRALRLSIVGELEAESWQRVGIASTAMTAVLLDELIATLDFPLITGHGKVPGHLENAINASKGTFTNTTSELEELLSTHVS